MIKSREGDETFDTLIPGFKILMEISTLNKITKIFSIKNGDAKNHNKKFAKRRVRVIKMGIFIALFAIIHKCYVYNERHYVNNNFLHKDCEEASA